MTRAVVVFPALILVLVGGLSIYAAFNFTWTALQFPLGAGVLLCAMCVAELAATLAGRHAGPTPDAERAGPVSWPSLIWIFALGGFLYVFGFIAGPALYLLICLRANRYSWAFAASIAAGSVVVTWGLFIKIIGVLLPVMPLWMS
jgi:hypothetical protein